MNPFKAIEQYVVTFAKALVGQIKVKIEDFLKSFSVEDLGRLAIDAVLYAQTLTDASSDEKRTAASEKFVADLKTAGHDVESFGTSLVNFFIESALQAVKSGIASA